MKIFEPFILKIPHLQVEGLEGGVKLSKEIQISLRKITRENWLAVADLEVSPDQRNLIGTNLRSLAEASVRPESKTLAVYNHDDVVGFVMYLLNEDDKYYYIHRFMIDSRYQRKGIGFEALKRVLDIVSKENECKDAIRILFLKHNKQAERLYERAGFKDTGVRVLDEKLFTVKRGYDHD